jgi:hypothetical protein
MNKINFKLIAAALVFGAAMGYMIGLVQMTVQSEKRLAEIAAVCNE